MAWEHCRRMGEELSPCATWLCNFATPPNSSSSRRMGLRFAVRDRRGANTHLRTCVPKPGVVLSGPQAEQLFDGELQASESAARDRSPQVCWACAADGEMWRIAGPAMWRIAT